MSGVIQERKVAKIDDSDDPNSHLDEKNYARAAQTVLMNTAAIVRGKNYRDLLFKLAFWRWDAPELGPSIDQMTRYEALAYSAVSRSR